MKLHRVVVSTGTMILSTVLAGVASAGIVVVDYTVDLGGLNNEPLNGLGARAIWDIDGTTLTITLQNTSTGVPASFEPSDQLVVSLGFNLPKPIMISAGVSALIEAGSQGLGTWNSRGPGDSVGEEWLWTNEFGGDLMEAWRQILSTSRGQNGGDHTRFDGKFNGDVDGPFGGIAADPPFLAIPNNRPAVADALVFSLTLSDTLTLPELEEVARGSIVEFGSDMRYLGAPAPGALGLLALAGLCARRRRR